MRVFIYLSYKNTKSNQPQSLNKMCGMNYNVIVYKIEPVVIRFIKKTAD